MAITYIADPATGEMVLQPDELTDAERMQLGLTLSLPLAAEIDDARAQLAAATTVATVRARSLVLDDLRAQQTAAVLQIQHQTGT